MVVELIVGGEGETGVVSIAVDAVKAFGFTEVHLEKWIFLCYPSLLKKGA